MVDPIDLGPEFGTPYERLIHSLDAGEFMADMGDPDDPFDDRE